MQTALRQTSGFRAATAALALLLAAASAASGETRKLERQIDVAPGTVVEIHNLAGTVTLVPTSGGSLNLTADVHAEASAGSSAAALAEAIAFDVRERGGRTRIETRYPLDRHRRYHYPAPGRQEGESNGWFGNLVGDGTTNITYLDTKVRVDRAPSSAAAIVWADIRAEVPAGVTIHFRNAVGRIESDGVEASQSLDTASGAILVTDSRGKLVADTGSGDVEVTGHAGDLAVDTGSGSVVLSRVESSAIAVDTGSGDVSLLDCSGDLAIDTGSGDIRGRGLVLGARVVADTGSGDVRLAGDFSATRHLGIDTGSGDVVLDVSGELSADLAVSTGSGEIQVELAGHVVRKVRGDLQIELGSGLGRADISTGSGDVTIAGR